jgi:hypothetical protein
MLSWRTRYRAGWMRLVSEMLLYWSQYDYNNYDYYNKTINYNNYFFNNDYDNDSTITKVLLL